jgi:asparagine synthase (glutamine-hydrolysing)
MCGIAGIVTNGKIDERAQQLLRKMCDVMVHRGPDDEGYYFSQRVGLGIRRLSIIDLQTGHQPVLNEDGTLAVVLNGEIYNYQELRDELIKKGHRLSTTGDTETIVHLYEEYGDELVQHLRGMFCFALWDERQQRLLVARDRIGIKQLYYAAQDGRLAFGSEIKCVLQTPEFRRRVNPQGLAAFLTFLYVPAPATIYEGIAELPPAHYLIWEEGRIQLRRYWKLEYRIDAGHPESYYIDGLLAKLSDAVKSHLVSDVPLGAFLSGGIDSGTVVALMTEALQGPVQTFTVGFEGDCGFYDERQEARLVAQRYHSKHHEFLVRPQVADILPRIITAFDQPLADSSAVPNYYICQLARSCVTVALSGMGGDELTGGYERYLGVLLGKQYRNLPAILRRAVAGGVGLLPDFGGKGRFSAARLKRFVRSAERDSPRAYIQLLSSFTTQELRRLLVGNWSKELEHFSPEDFMVQIFRESGSDSPVNQMLFADVTGYLPGDLLPLTDRMSMAHSLEVRVPFLDHELLEYAASIPPDIKIRRFTKKYILKKAAAKLLPKEILRREKRGFSVPLSFWLRSELRSFIEEQLAPERVAEMGYFDPRSVSDLLREHLSARANHENKLWALLIFSLWHDLYMTGAQKLPHAEHPAGVVERS